MPFEFICPHCFEKKWVEDAYAGKEDHVLTVAE